MRKAIFVIITVLILSNNLVGQFKTVGYVPNWVNLTTFTNGFDFSRVSDLCIAFKDPDASGNLPAMTTGENYLVTKAHENGVRVFLSLCGGNSSTNTTIRNNYFTLINTTNRSNFCSKLKQYTIDNNLDGLDIDLEGPAINSDYGAFIQVLADSLHPEGKLLTSALSEGYGGGNVPNSTFPYFDWINIMAYDATGTWVGSPVGQHSSYQMAVDALDYWKGRGLPKQKAILGVPFYGYGFLGQSGYKSYRSIATNYPDNIYDDEAGNIIYFNGISTIMDKTSLALVEGGGIMIWELSLDATGDASLLKAIKYVVDLTSVDNNNYKETFMISPNPSNGIFNIKGIDVKNVEVEVVNSYGQQIVTMKNNATLDLSNEPKGVYYLYIRQENKMSSHKIVLF